SGGARPPNRAALFLAGLLPSDRRQFGPDVCDNRGWGRAASVAASRPRSCSGGAGRSHTSPVPLAGLSSPAWWSGTVVGVSVGSVMVFSATATGWQRGQRVASGDRGACGSTLRRFPSTNSPVPRRRVGPRHPHHKPALNKKFVTQAWTIMRVCPTQTRGHPHTHTPPEARAT